MLVMRRAARNSRGAAVVGTRTTSSANSSAWPDVGHNLQVGNLGNIFVKKIFVLLTLGSSVYFKNRIGTFAFCNYVGPRIFFYKKLTLNQCCESELASTRIRIQLFISMGIRIQEAKPMQIQADPDQDPGQTYKSQNLNFYIINILKVGNRKKTYIRRFKSPFDPCGSGSGSTTLLLTITHSLNCRVRKKLFFLELRLARASSLPKLILFMVHKYWNSAQNTAPPFCVSVLRIRNTVMRIRIPLFTLMRIRIRLLTLMRFRIWTMLLIKEIQICDLWSKDLHGSSLSLHVSIVSFERPSVAFVRASTDTDCLLKTSVAYPQGWANLDQAHEDLDRNIFRDLSPTPKP
jgi:hypothetical protein